MGVNIQFLDNFGIPRGGPKWSKIVNTGCQTSTVFQTPSRHPFYSVWEPKMEPKRVEKSMKIRVLRAPSADDKNTLFFVGPAQQKEVKM